MAGVCCVGRSTTSMAARLAVGPAQPPTTHKLYCYSIAHTNSRAARGPARAANRRGQQAPSRPYKNLLWHQASSLSHIHVMHNVQTDIAIMIKCHFSNHITYIYRHIQNGDILWIYSLGLCTVQRNDICKTDTFHRFMIRFIAWYASLIQCEFIVTYY